MMTKKELRNEYKLKPPEMGVYQIRNTVTGKIFVGSTTTLGTIWNSQRFQLETGNHRSVELQQDWQKYGAEAFVFEPLHQLKLSDDPAFDARRELKGLEELTVEELQPFGAKGYNKPVIVDRAIG